MESLIFSEILFIIGKFYERNRSNVTVRWAYRSDFRKKSMLSELIISRKVIAVKICSDFEIIKRLMFWCLSHTDLRCLQVDSQI